MIAEKVEEQREIKSLEHTIGCLKNRRPQDYGILMFLFFDGRQNKEIKETTEGGRWRCFSWFSCPRRDSLDSLTR